MIERAFEGTKVAKLASDEAQTAAMLNTSQGFVTKYEVKFAIFCATNSEVLH